jgi:SagB-type dehydrogenase family enzyme
MGGAPMQKEPYKNERYFLKDSVRLTIDFSETDQSLGIPPPPLQKQPAEDATLIDLIPHDKLTVPPTDLVRAIGQRRSHRAFTSDPLSIEELSFLLWATQGVRKVVPPYTAYRTVPSAGCRHTFETYLCAFNVTGLDQAIYRYLPLDHQLVLEQIVDNLKDRVSYAALGQPFAGKAAVTFIWTTIPYRMEWRYGKAAHKVIAIDVGHVCQNLYLACEAIGAGTCAIGAYYQEEMDRLIRVNGADEFTIYLAPVGKKSS